MRACSVVLLALLVGACADPPPDFTRERWAPLLTQGENPDHAWAYAIGAARPTGDRDVFVVFERVPFSRPDSAYPAGRYTAGEKYVNCHSYMAHDARNWILDSAGHVLSEFDASDLDWKPDAFGRLYCVNAVGVPAT